MKKRKSIFTKFFLLLFKILKAIFIGIYNFLIAIKSAFLIPLLSISASIITFAIIVFVKPFINFLPDYLNNGFIETFLAALAFIGINFAIFNDRLQHDYEFSYSRFLVSFAVSVLFWILPIFLFNNEISNIQIYLSENRSLSFLSLLFVILYSPHLWLMTITGEFYYSIAICLSLNCLAVIALSVFDLKTFLRMR